MSNTDAQTAALTLAMVERLLVREAGLLDRWMLAEWLQECMCSDATYRIPSLDAPDSNHRTALFLVSDTHATLSSRVNQLLGRSAWAESPRSRTRRLVTNVDIVDPHQDHPTVTANFAVWRFQGGQTDVYVGRYEHVLRHEGGTWRIQDRRVILDMETLRPHGKLSFIL